MQKIDLPDTPPALTERVELTDHHLTQIGVVLSNLSRDLEGLPVILAQQGETVHVTGAADQLQLISERLARVSERLWRAGVLYAAREVIRFEEESIEEVERANFMLYSLHIKGALILTVGWQMTVSLTQVRAETADAKAQLIRLIKK